MDAAQAHTELARRLVDAPLEYPLEAYRILSGLTRSALELPQLLELLEGGIDRLRAGDRLEADFRGASLEEKMHDFRAGLAEASEAVHAVEQGLDKAFRAIGHVSYKEAAAEPSRCGTRDCRFELSAWSWTAWVCARAAGSRGPPGR